MSNVARVTYRNHRPLSGLRRVTVRQKFSNHTIAFLDYEFTYRREYLLPAEGTPVSTVWGSTPTGRQTTYGYVNHYETVSDENDIMYSRIVVVGTSKPMNSVRTKSWAGQTRSSIVRDIAAHHRLRSVVHDHPHVVENWATGTRSDFQSLKALAQEAGYLLWVDGATLWFLDPDKALLTASSMTTPVVRRNTIRDVRVMGGSNIPGEMTGSTRQVQYGLDYRTNEFFAAVDGDTSSPTEVSAASVTSFGDAQSLLAASGRKQRDYYVLKAKVDGQSALYPGALARVQSGRVNSDQAGTWLVTEATHEITSEDFITEFVATRSVDSESHVRSTARGASGVTTAVVRDGSTWEAELQEQVRG